MNVREELTIIIASPESFDGGPASCGPNAVYAARTADAILAAGYSKPTNEQTSAVTAMAGISEVMDSMFRGHTSQQETLNQIAKTLGAYEMGRI